MLHAVDEQDADALHRRAGELAVLHRLANALVDGRPVPLGDDAADVPLAEMFGYSTTLRSMSQGRAVYSMQFDHYEEVPKSVAEEIITKKQK